MREEIQWRRRKVGRIRGGGGTKGNKWGEKMRYGRKLEDKYNNENKINIEVIKRIKIKVIIEIKQT